MAKELVNEQACPACGAALRFDPESGKLVCDWCGTVTELKTEKEEKSEAQEKAKEKAKEKKDSESLEGFDFDSLNDRATDPDAEAVPIYHCKSCGAELIAPPEQISMTCPYCGSNVVLTQKVSGKLRPDGIIPFKISAKELPALLKGFYRKKVLLPRNFFSAAVMEKVTGVYVPFWVFSGKLTGELLYTGESSSTTRSGDYLVTETKYYDLNRNVSVDFENVPVDCSGRVDDRLMDSLEPFGMEDVVPFDMRYLAGFTSDRFDEPKDTIAERAKKRMFASAESTVRARSTTGYSKVSQRGGHLTANLTAKYLLFPVYLFSLKFDNKKYKFAVNGQTGMVVGTLPTDKSVVRRYFLIRFAALLIPIVLLFVIKYLAGR